MLPGPAELQFLTMVRSSDLVDASKELPAESLVRTWLLMPDRCDGPTAWLGACRAQAVVAHGAVWSFLHGRRGGRLDGQPARPRHIPRGVVFYVRRLVLAECNPLL